MSLDLEMNQPSGSIIEIGAVFGNLHTGEVYERFSRFICLPPGETLAPKIQQLTHINPEDLLPENGAVSLWEGFIELRNAHVKHNCFITPFTWGGNDSKQLWDQLKLTHPTARIPWRFGFRVNDLKSFYHLYRAKQRLKVQSGLAKSLQRLGVGPFQGTKHRAVDDAFNTFVGACHAMTKIIAP